MRRCTVLSDTPRPSGTASSSSQAGAVIQRGALDQALQQREQAQHETGGHRVHQGPVEDHPDVHHPVAQDRVEESRERKGYRDMSSRPSVKPWRQDLRVAQGNAHDEHGAAPTASSAAAAAGLASAR